MIIAASFCALRLCMAIAANSSSNLVASSMLAAEGSVVFLEKMKDGLPFLVVTVDSEGDGVLFAERSTLVVDGRLPLIMIFLLEGDMFTGPALAR